MSRVARSLARALAALAIVLPCWASTSAFAQSCAMCASSFAPDDPLQRAFSLSILFLMAAPYTIVGVIAGWLFFTHRRAAGRRRKPVIDLARVRRPLPAGGPEGDLP